jgi:hypothetical protein
MPFSLPNILLIPFVIKSGRSGWPFPATYAEARAPHLLSRYGPLADGEHCPKLRSRNCKNAASCGAEWLRQFVRSS